MSKKRFKKIYIEITNVCNLSCSFCEPDNRKKEFMTEEQFKKILQDIKPYTDYVYFHVKGEPLLHPAINEMIEEAAKEGIQVNLTTNGTCLDKLTSKKVRQINYSMQSTKDVEEMKRIIQKLRKYSKESNAYISLRLWTNEIKRNQEIKNMLESEFGKIEELKDKMTLDTNIFVSIEEEFTWPEVAIQNECEQGYCYGLKDHIAILVDGTVVPCCLDHKGQIVLGNILQENLSNILEKKRTKSIIEGFQNRIAVEELCKKCMYKNKF